MNDTFYLSWCFMMGGRQIYYYRHRTTCFSYSLTQSVHKQVSLKSENDGVKQVLMCFFTRTCLTHIASHVHLLAAWKGMCILSVNINTSKFKFNQKNHCFCKHHMKVTMQPTDIYYRCWCTTTNVCCLTDYLVCNSMQIPCSTFWGTMDWWSPFLLMQKAASCPMRYRLVQ